MIEELPRSEGNSLGYEVTDTLSKEEYEEILANVELAIDKYGSAKLLLDLSRVSDSYAEFDAYEEDFDFYLRHGDEMECYAVVGDDSVHEWGTKLGDRVTETDLEFFDAKSLDEAWEYVREQ